MYYYAVVVQSTYNSGDGLEMVKTCDGSLIRKRLVPSPATVSAVGVLAEGTLDAASDSALQPTC